jgi:hypothetical protein
LFNRDSLDDPWPRKAELYSTHQSTDLVLSPTPRAHELLHAKYLRANHVNGESTPPNLRESVKTSTCQKAVRAESNGGTEVSRIHPFILSWVNTDRYVEKGWHGARSQNGISI